MKNSKGGGFILLISIVSYIILKNWVFILVMAIILTAVLLLVIWIKSIDKQQSKINDRSIIHDSTLKAQQQNSRNAIASSRFYNPQNILLSFIKDLLNSPINTHTLSSVRRIQDYMDKYRRLNKPIPIGLFDFIINCANDRLNTVKDSRHKDRIIAECKTVILISTELKKGTSNEQIIDLFRIDNNQIKKIDSLIRYVLRTPYSSYLINYILRIQKYREKYRNQKEQHVEIFDFIINCANHALENVKESNHKKRIVDECNTVIYIITELKKGESFEAIMRSYNERSTTIIQLPIMGYPNTILTLSQDQDKTDENT